MDSIQCKTKELLTYHCGGHGNLVTIAKRYVDDTYRPDRTSVPNMDSIQLETKGKVKCIRLRLRLRLIASLDHVPLRAAMQDQNLKIKIGGI